MKKLSFIFLFLLLAALAKAQTTKVWGQVIDGSDGKPIPFAAVYFEGSRIGTSTDDKGYFTLNARDSTLNKVVASMLGYKAGVQQVKPGIFSKLFFILPPAGATLPDARVKADNSKARRMLAAIQANRRRHNPQDRDSYACDVYSKIELDVTHPREQLRGKAVRKQWGFIFDYVDTSDVSGLPYLPVFISESVSRRRHRLNPEFDNEEIISHKISGADPTGNILTQFTGSTLLQNNFYDQFINDFNLEIPSPICEGGLLFYNYFIIDSLDIDSRKTYHVRYHPKPAISSPAFDGEMFVDAEDWALRRIKAKLQKDGSVNWVRDMVLEADYQRLEDGSWFYGTNRMYADFSVWLADSTKIMSFIANRELHFSPPQKDSASAEWADGPVKVRIDESRQSDTYWEQVRPYALSEKEKNIYVMVDKVQQTRLYRTWYDVVRAVVNNYYDVGPVSFGPILKLASYNKVEGVRLQVGMRTSEAFSSDDRLGFHLAYAFRDKQVKGGLRYEHMFSHEPTLKLTLDARYDMLQLGRGSGLFADANFLSSLLGGGWSGNPLPCLDASMLLDWEANASFNTAWQLMYRQYFGNWAVPFRDAYGPIRSIPSAQGTFSLRWSYGETVHRGPFKKTSLYTKFPIITLDVTAGASWLDHFDAHSYDGVGHPFLRPELKISYDVSMGPVGRSHFLLSGGGIIGRVPYPMLHLHPGNGTFIFDESAFSTMRYMEYASDVWMNFMWEHNFKGFFFGKIPYVKKLNIREVAHFRMGWGYLSPMNRGENALVTLPAGLSDMGSVPFIEAGFGLTNILRLFRVDFIWRCTHRQPAQQKPRNFVVNFGVDLQF